MFIDIVSFDSATLGPNEELHHQVEDELLLDLTYRQPIYTLVDSSPNRQ